MITNFKNFLNERQFTTTKREKLSKEKKALPDGSFPIVTEKDLKNAIKSYGRSKNPDKAKRWIIRRAREMNKINILPDKWNIKK